MNKARKWLDQMNPWHASIDGGGKDEKLPNKPTSTTKLSAPPTLEKLETKNHTKGKHHLNLDETRFRACSSGVGGRQKGPGGEVNQTPIEPLPFRSSPKTDS